MKKNQAAPARRRGAQAGGKVRSGSLPTHGGEGTVRIVSGRFKRTPIAVGLRDGLRPTPSRVRETLFDWLRHFLGDFSGAFFLDMFAGSGALGLEAASNGAGGVVLLEKDGKSARTINAVIEKLGAGDTVRCIQADAFAWVKEAAQKFDVVFIDPPFALKLQQRAVQAALPLLKDEGFVYLESEEPLEDAALQEMGLAAVRRGRAAAVHYLLAARAIG